MNKYQKALLDNINSSFNLKLTLAMIDCLRSIKLNNRYNEFKLSIENEIKELAKYEWGEQTCVIFDNNTILIENFERNLFTEIKL